MSFILMFGISGLLFLSAVIFTIFRIYNSSDPVSAITKNPNRIGDFDLNTKVEVAPGNFRTIGYCLAASVEGRAILMDHLDSFRTIKLDENIVWLLSGTKEGCFLLKNSHHPLKKIDPDTKPESESRGDNAIIWRLVKKEIGCSILRSSPEFLAKIDPNDKAKFGDDRGKTIACFLAKNPEGRRILRENKTLTAKINPAITPEMGNDASKTVVWWLAALEGGLVVLKENPMLLNDTNLFAKSGSKSQEYPNTSVAWWLSSTPAGQWLLREHVENLNASGPYEKLVALLTSLNNSMIFRKNASLEDVQSCLQNFRKEILEEINSENKKIKDLREKFLEVAIGEIEKRDEILEKLQEVYSAFKLTSDNIKENTKDMASSLYKKLPSIWEGENFPTSSDSFAELAKNFMEILDEMYQIEKKSADKSTVVSNNGNTFFSAVKEYFLAKKEDFSTSSDSSVKLANNCMEIANEISQIEKKSADESTMIPNNGNIFFPPAKDDCSGMEILEKKDAQSLISIQN